MKPHFLTAASIVVLLAMGCKKNNSDDNNSGSNGNNGGGTTVGADVPDVYRKIYGASSITTDGTWIYIKTSGTPDHKSVYYPTSNTLYEDFSGTTYGGYQFNRAPGSVITTMNYTFKIPKNPQAAANHQATQGGAIGVSLNGVPFFNQYNGQSQPLGMEIVSFDQWWGHPAPGGDYHYHVEPKYLTTVKATKSSLLGFLLDGFPVYGPEEAGATIVNSDLDAYHGHTAVTADYPAGIYHYHITATDPYLNGSGYYGIPGTASR